MEPRVLLRLEVGALRHSIHASLDAADLDIRTAVDNAVKQACTENYIQQIVSEAVRKYVKETIDSETKDFFYYGEGRKIIQQRVKEKLEKEFDL